MYYYKSISLIGEPIIKILMGDIPLTHDECILQIYELERNHGWSFNCCSALKYLWRLGIKTHNIKPDVNKAIQYLSWELENPHPKIDLKCLSDALFICLQLVDSAL